LTEIIQIFHITCKKLGKITVVPGDLLGFSILARRRETYNASKVFFLKKKNLVMVIGGDLTARIITMSRSHYL